MTAVDFFRIGKQLLRLLRREPTGKKHLIARAGVPVARPVPLAREEPRRPGLAGGRLTEAFFDPLPADELAAWK
jgi:antitoxin (DNA-binding transcriptional repressor) of toxin-antitoxin stability system